jgi:hypothetical protein
MIVPSTSVSQTSSESKSDSTREPTTADRALFIASFSQRLGSSECSVFIVDGDALLGKTYENQTGQDSSGIDSCIDMSTDALNHTMRRRTRLKVFELDLSSSHRQAHDHSGPFEPIRDAIPIRWSWHRSTRPRGALWSMMEPQALPFHRRPMAKGVSVCHSSRRSLPYSRGYYNLQSCSL